MSTFGGIHTRHDNCSYNRLKSKLILAKDANSVMCICLFVCCRGHLLSFLYSSPVPPYISIWRGNQISKIKDQAS